MLPTTSMWRRLASPLAALGSTLLLHPSPVSAADAPALYDIVIETSMPHLDENLRYATRREQACLDTSDLSLAFPVLHDVSLQDCRLVKGTAADTEGVAVYTLTCRGGHGTTGEARWRIEADRLTGTLNVKLGGKNMTFYQRITGRTAGACVRP